METPNVITYEEMYECGCFDDIFAFIYFDKFYTPVYKIRNFGFLYLDKDYEKVDIDPVIIKAPTESFINGSEELTFALPNLPCSALYYHDGRLNIGGLNLLTKKPLKITIEGEYDQDYYNNCVLRVRVDKEKTKLYEDYKNMWSDEIAKEFGFDVMQ